jgi:hypothetical protein
VGVPSTGWVARYDAHAGLRLAALGERSRGSLLISDRRAGVLVPLGALDGPLDRLLADEGRFAVARDDVWGLGRLAAATSRAGPRPAARAAAARSRCSAVCGACAPTIDADGDGASECTDCDDRDPTVHPGAPEVCNGADDDCDGLTDTADGSLVPCDDGNPCTLDRCHPTLGCRPEPIPGCGDATTSTTTSTTSTTASTTSTSATTTTSVTTSTSTTAPPVARCGDVSADGRVDVTDALAVAQFGVGLRACGEVPFADPLACDVNPQPTPGEPDRAPDGACDVADALLMAQCSVGLRACEFVCAPWACFRASVRAGAESRQSALPRKRRVPFFLTPASE